jgi:membrane protein DedA with SNARE-associated domain
VLGPGLQALWPYAGVLLAAIIEGEIAYLAAAALVAQGELNAFGVFMSGAFGASIGDQMYFYLFRGRLPRWVARFPSLQERTAPLVDRVRRHAALAVLMIRFSPGLRVALAAACAWVDVSPRLFSLLNLLSSFVWAAVLLVLVGWFGPTVLASFGLDGWKGAAVIGIVLLALFKAFGSYERRALERRESR